MTMAQNDPIKDALKENIEGSKCQTLVQDLSGPSCGGTENWIEDDRSTS